MIWIAFLTGFAAGIKFTFLWMWVDMHREERQIRKHDPTMLDDDL
jgi:hypothetical protein